MCMFSCRYLVHDLFHVTHGLDVYGFESDSSTRGTFKSVMIHLSGCYDAL